MIVASQRSMQKISLLALAITLSVAATPAHAKCQRLFANQPCPEEIAELNAKAVSEYQGGSLPGGVTTGTLSPNIAKDYGITVHNEGAPPIVLNSNTPGVAPVPA